MTTKPNPKAMNKTQLSRAYNVHISTFSRWVKKFENKLGDVTGRVYTPKQVAIIFEHLGEP